MFRSMPEELDFLLKGPAPSAPVTSKPTKSPAKAPKTPKKPVKEAKEKEVNEEEDEWSVSESMVKKLRNNFLSLIHI